MSVLELHERPIELLDRSGGKVAGLAAGDGDNLPVSESSKGRIRYSVTNQRWEQSTNGGAWGPLGAVSQAYSTVKDSTGAALTQRSVLKTSARLAPSDVGGETVVDLAVSGVTAGSYNSVTVDTYGRVTSGNAIGYVTQAYATVQANGTPLTQRTTLNVLPRLQAQDSGGVTTLDLPTVITGAMYGGNEVSSITVDAYGRVTAVGTANYTVSAGAGLSGGGTLSSNPTISMPNVGPGAGPIGTAGITSITLDAQGRVTAATTATYVAATRQVIAGTGLTGGGALSSDVTLSLATSGVSAGTYNTVTVDTLGRVTVGANTAYALGSNTVSAGAGLTGGGAISSNPTIAMPNVGPGAGLIGGSGIASVTLDAQGRVTAAATATYATVANISIPTDEIVFGNSTGITSYTASAPSFPFVYKRATGRFGVGTANPSVAFHISGPGGTEARFWSHDPTNTSTTNAGYSAVAGGSDFSNSVTIAVLARGQSFTGTLAGLAGAGLTSIRALGNGAGVLSGLAIGTGTATPVHVFTGDTVRGTWDQFGNLIPRSTAGSALATAATDGWIHLTAIAGPPTGTPGHANAGGAPAGVDTTNGHFYWYASGWKRAATLTDLAGYVPITRTVSAGGALSGGGALSSNVTISLNTIHGGISSGGGASFINSITVDTYGRVTAVTANTPGTGGALTQAYTTIQDVSGAAQTQRFNLRFANTFSLGDNGSATTVDLHTTGVTPGAYNTVLVDVYGRVSAASNAAYPTASIAASQVAFGSGTNAITGSSQFTYSSGSNILLLTGTGSAALEMISTGGKVAYFGLSSSGTVSIVPADLFNVTTSLGISSPSVSILRADTSSLAVSLASGSDLFRVSSSGSIFPKEGIVTAAGSTTGLQYVRAVASAPFGDWRAEAGVSNAAGRPILVHEQTSVMYVGDLFSDIEWSPLVAKWPIRIGTVVSTYTLTDADMIFMSAPAGAGTVNVILPPAGTRSGRVYLVKNMGPDAQLQVKPTTGESIDYLTDKVITLNYGDATLFFSSGLAFGSNWHQFPFGAFF